MSHEAHPAVESELGDYTADRRMIFISGLAIIVGALGAVLAWFLYRLIMLATNIFYFGHVTAQYADPAASPFGWKAIFVPVIGGLIVGLIARYGSAAIRGHGMPEAIEAVLLRGARVQPRLTILKPLATAIAIGSGGPFGAEGPIIMTGGSVGSLIAQLLRMSDAERTTLLVAGASAGMSATFLSPISAILLAVELLLFEWRPRSLVPVAIASVTAAALRRLLLGAGPVFPMPSTNITIPENTMPLAILVGLVIGFAAILLSRFLYRCEDFFEKLPVHWMWWPAIGGLVVGIGGYFYPPALGIGYNVIQKLLLGDYTWHVIIGVIVVKSIIWIVSLSSGTSGGILAPMLLIGGAMGAALGHVLPFLANGAWPMVAMAAMLAGAIGAPLTSAMLVVELTHNSGLLLPVLLACVVSYGLNVLLQKRSILTERLSRRGHHLSREYGVDPMEMVIVSQAMHTSLFALPATATRQEAANWLKRMEERGPEAWSHWQRLFPIVDKDGKLLAILTRTQMMNSARQADLTQPLINDASRSPKVVSPGDTLRMVAASMAESKFTRYPVVDGDRRLLGIITIEDLLVARTKQISRESSRERALRIRWPFSSANEAQDLPGAPAAEKEIAALDGE
ncbi:MAG: chloride channel protein [Acidobacteria bacterium]|nr:chloride channel protein [Acidobacteriota bacterium]